MDIVCVPFHDIKLAQIEGFRTRDAHLYQHFEKDQRVSRVIIINRPTMFGELILRRKKLLTDGRLIYSKSGVRITQVSSKTLAIDVVDFSFMSPLLRGKIFIRDLYAANRLKIITALEFLKVHEFISYESSPLSVNFLKSITPLVRVFDGVDNLCKHSTYKYHRKILLDDYNYVLSSYEIVYFNSLDTIRFFGASSNSKVAFLQNGVDFEIFRNDYPIPPLIANLSRPVVVYAGKMQEMLDLDLVIELAERFQGCTFLMLGKCLIPGIRERFQSHSNVVFGGDIPYDMLPSYICNSDVCFIPYKVDCQHGGDPIKFYEYMAANKPVVSTRIGEIASFNNGENIFVCDRAEFGDAINKALAFSGDICNDLPEDITWRFKAKEILDVVFKNIKLTDRC